MTSSIETLGTLERRVQLSIPGVQIASEIDKRLKNLAKSVKMPGFRPGKVPLKMVAQNYGASVQAEVISDAVNKSFADVVAKAEIKVAGVLNIEPVEAPEGSADALFNATFEVYPVVTLNDLSAVSIEKPVTEVSDAEIDKTIEILRKQRTTYSAADRAAQDGDMVTLSFSGSIDGVAFAGGQAENFPFVLGQGRMLPDFEQGARGMSAGESKTIQVAFPEDYHGKEVAGKTADFVLSVSKVEAPQLPTVDEEFAKTLGIADGDIAKMRADIKANLEREVENRLKARLKDKVLDVLVQQAQLEVPKALINADVERLEAETRKDLEKRGVKVDNAPIPRDLLENRATERVRLGLVVSDLVKKQSLEAKPEQVRKAVEDIAQSYEQPAQVVSWYLSDRSRLADVEASVLEQNVVDWVLSQTKTTDLVVSFDELMGVQAL